MQIDLSQDEIETLGSALECWEKEPTNGAFMTQIMATILAPEGKREHFDQKAKEANEKSEVQTKLRKTRSLLLRAKLLGAIQSQMIGQS